MPICGFRKPDGTECRRRVACCWRHYRGYRGRWHALATNPTLLLLLAVASVVIGALALFSTPRVVTKVFDSPPDQNLTTVATVAVTVHRAGGGK